MKNLNNNKILKTISLMLVIIFITNALIPIPSYADTDEEVGGKLFKPVFKLFAGVGDLSIKILQGIFIGYSDIKEELEAGNVTSEQFQIRYSPGVIFSNKVPGLNANFINPPKGTYQVQVNKTPELKQINFANYGYTEIMGTKSGEITRENAENTLKLTTDYGYNSSNVEKLNSSLSDQWIRDWIGSQGTPNLYKWSYNGKTYYLSEDTGSTTNNGVKTVTTTLTLYEEGVSDVVTGKERSYTSDELQGTISKWYKALRMVSIVGLLSVLVYMGIRMLISSTGQDKAKYKKMLGDWVAAMCILFLLHYIMAFTMSMVEEITDIFKTNVVDEQGVDVLMSHIRTNINSEQFSSLTSFSSTVMYIILVGYTWMFTWHYLKRLVFLAFLTMIAPLIALTYPLDKIKDGQAQAFSMWLREYIFNALIPVIHIVLYSIFVGSAMDLALQNPLYAIVCIGFLTQAEKFFRKMFGFDKAQSVSQLGAAAGGAMVMNAINKVGSKGGSKSGGGSGSKDSGSKTPRTGGYMPAPDAGSGGSGTKTTALGQEISTGQPTPQMSGTNVKAGLKGVGKKYLNKPNTMKAGKWAGRTFRKAAVGGLGAAALGTAGLVAGIATGDMSKALQYGGAGLLAGAKGANALGDKFTDIEKRNREAFKENAWGTDEYNTRNSIKELNVDSDFMRTCDQLGLSDNEREDAIRMLAANGITSTDDIKSAMNIRAQHMKDADGPVSQEEIVAAAKMHKSLSKSYWGQPKNVDDYRNRLKAQGLSDQQANRAIRLISDFKGDLS